MKCPNCNSVWDAMDNEQFNQETIDAMIDARNGNVVSFNNVDELMDDLFGGDDEMSKM